MSDNGGVLPQASNYPHRGQKMSLFEVRRGGGEGREWRRKEVFVGVFCYLCFIYFSFFLSFDLFLFLGRSEGSYVCS